jgi:hypothetical protein
LAAWQKLQKEKELFPTKYSIPKTPSLWNRDLPLRLFVDKPMHVLFLGIPKSVFRKISLWSARCGRGPAFKKVGINLLKDVEELKLHGSHLTSKRLTRGEVGYLKNSNPYQELRFGFTEVLWL